MLVLRMYSPIQYTYVLTNVSTVLINVSVRYYLSSVLQAVRDCNTVCRLLLFSVAKCRLADILSFATNVEVQN